MNFDLRLPLGLIFSLLGVMLVAYGIFGDHAVYARSLGIDVNQDWGAVLLVFGAAMLALAIRGRRRR